MSLHYVKAYNSLHHSFPGHSYLFRRRALVWTRSITVEKLCLVKSVDHSQAWKNPILPQSIFCDYLLLDIDFEKHDLQCPITKPLENLDPVNLYLIVEQVLALTHQSYHWDIYHRNHSVSIDRSRFRQQITRLCPT